VAENDGKNIWLNSDLEVDVVEENYPHLNNEFRFRNPPIPALSWSLISKYFLKSDKFS